MRLFDAGARDGPSVLHGRLITAPNALSVLRLLALPWIYADLVGGHHLRALLVLAVVASTDWLDGYLARRLDQASRLGAVLDPLVDRLLIVVAAVGLVVARIVPLWAVLLLLARDALLLGGALLLLLRRVPVPPVNRVGKSATFGLMVALPLFLLTAVLDGTAAAAALRGAAWVLFAVHLVLYYLAAALYLRTVLGATATPPVRRGAGRPSRGELD